MARRTAGDGGYGFSFVLSLMNPRSWGCSPGRYPSILAMFLRNGSSSGRSLPVPGEELPAEPLPGGERPRDGVGGDAVGDPEMPFPPESAPRDDQEVFLPCRRDELHLVRRGRPGKEIEGPPGGGTG